MTDEKETLKTTRRDFLKTAAIGAAAVAAAAVAPSAGMLASKLPQIVNAGDLGGDSPLVAYVRDAAKGEIVLMWGTKEVVFHDFGLVSRLGLLMGR